PVVGFCNRQCAALEECTSVRRASFARLSWPWRVLAITVCVIIGLPMVLVALYRFVPPPTTPLAATTWLEEGPIAKEWKPLAQISPSLVKAVIAAEDNKFCSHYGFDWESIDKAMDRNARGGTVRGASTISQQTAKNLFLPANRSWLRKGAE